MHTDGTDDSESEYVLAIPKTERPEEPEQMPMAEPTMDYNEDNRQQDQNSFSYRDREEEQEIRVVVSEPRAAPREPSERQAEAKASRTAPSGHMSIGAILREARLDRGDDLYLIAEYLRIKPSFLIALENSRFEEFPADAYVIGFLRTYATCLGIDGKAAVDRYRYEMAGRRKKPVLSMPTPVSEGRTPSALVMAGATIVLILIYALWYAISSSDRAEVRTQPSLPTVLQSVPNPAAAGLTAPVQAPAPAAQETPVEPLALTPVPAAPEPETPLPAPQPSPEPEQSSQTVPSGIPPASPGIVVTAQTPISVSKNVFSNSSVKPKEEETPKKADTKEAKAEKKDEKEAKIEKKAESKPRVVIRTTQNSWIMIIDKSGKTIVDRVLKPGEAYTVPNTKGLSMTTGNGAALSVSVDGKEMPKVATGEPRVVRNISLDPKSLEEPSNAENR
ncbi:MAG: DUF4115 domain-containing protein [Alphaproteobacteria bacterium]|nr:DUF4115 domain-containing protein [Alphaproteobacteria bacterium]